MTEKLDLQNVECDEALAPRKPYIEPAVAEEEAFETFVLACSKMPGRCPGVVKYS